MKAVEIQKIIDEKKVDGLPAIIRFTIQRLKNLAESEDEENVFVHVHKEHISEKELKLLKKLGYDISESEMFPMQYKVGV